MFLVLVQIIASVLLILVILLQMQGSGLSTTFGGGGEFYRSKQGIEKVLIGSTIALTIIFASVSIVALLPR